MKSAVNKKLATINPKNHQNNKQKKIALHTVLSSLVYNSIT